MRRWMTAFLAVMMILLMCLILGACKEKEVASIASEEIVAEEAGAKAISETADIIKTIEPDAEETIGKDIPLQIESIILYKDGSIRIVPTDDLKKNEIGDSEADSIMPFAESGTAKDIYVLKIGNGGYRVILALMDDGTISAVNSLSLLEDHICVVMDNVAGRDNFVGIEQAENEDEGEGEDGNGNTNDERNGNGFSIIGKTETGDDVVLDPILLSDNARVTAEEEDTQ